MTYVHSATLGAPSRLDVLMSHSRTWQNASNRYDLFMEPICEAVKAWESPELCLLEEPCLRRKEYALKAAFQCAWSNSKLKQDRIDLLISFARLLGQLSGQERMEKLTLTDFYEGTSNKHDVNFLAIIDFSVNEEQFKAELRAKRIYDEHPILIIKISKLSENEEDFLGTILLGCDCNGNQKPHLDISDINSPGGKWKWVHQYKLSDVWENDQQMARFIRQFFLKLVKPLAN